MGQWECKRVTREGAGMQAGREDGKGLLGGVRDWREGGGGFGYGRAGDRRPPAIFCGDTEPVSFRCAEGCKVQTCRCVKGKR